MSSPMVSCGLNKSERLVLYLTLLFPFGTGVSGREILAGAVPLPPAAQPLYEALARCHVYATGTTPGRPTTTSGGAGLLGPIDERQTMENYEYGEFITPGVTNNVVPNEVLPNTNHIPDHHSVAGMSDITSEPGY